MPVGIGPHKPRRDLGAIDRAGDGSESLAENGEVETGEMKEFQYLGVVQKPLQIGRLGLPFGDLHELGVAVAPGELDEAEPVALRVEPKRFGVDRHDRAKIEAVGEIAFVQSNSHFAASLFEDLVSGL